LLTYGRIVEEPDQGSDNIGLGHAGLMGVVAKCVVVARSTVMRTGLTRPPADGPAGAGLFDRASSAAGLAFAVRIVMPFVMIEPLWI